MLNVKRQNIPMKTEHDQTVFLKNGNLYAAYEDRT